MKISLPNTDQPRSWTRFVRPAAGIILAGGILILGIFGIWAFMCQPGSTELFITANKEHVRIGEPVEIRLELTVNGRVPVKERRLATSACRSGQSRLVRPRDPWLLV